MKHLDPLPYKENGIRHAEPAPPAPVTLPDDVDREELPRALHYALQQIQHAYVLHVDHDEQRATWIHLFDPKSAACSYGAALEIVDHLPALTDVAARHLFERGRRRPIERKPTPTEDPMTDEIATTTEAQPAPVTLTKEQYTIAELCELLGIESGAQLSQLFRYADKLAPGVYAVHAGTAAYLTELTGQEVVYQDQETLDRVVDELWGEDVPSEDVPVDGPPVDEELHADEDPVADAECEPAEDVIENLTDEEVIEMFGEHAERRPVTTLGIYAKAHDTTTPQAGGDGVQPEAGPPIPPKPEKPYRVNRIYHDERPGLARVQDALAHFQQARLLGSADDAERQFLRRCEEAEEHARATIRGVRRARWMVRLAKLFA